MGLVFYEAGRPDCCILSEYLEKSLSRLKDGIKEKGYQK
jgi:hypothetical protein